MNSRERVLTALNQGIPDKTPFMELLVDEALGKRLLGRKEPVYHNNPPSLDGYNPSFGFTGWDYYTPDELCQKLRMDGWGFSLMPQLQAEEKEVAQKNGNRTYLTNGGITSKEDLKKIKLADLNDETVFEYANDYINKHRGDNAVWVQTNLGTDPVILSLGWMTFSTMVLEDIGLIEEMLDIYTEWMAEAVRKLCMLDIDFIWFTDDIAFKNGLFFSPDFYRETCMPRLRKVARACTKPSVYHTDGNFLSVTEDLLSLGFNGLHPIEPEAMDIFDFKKMYQDKVCTIGNIDLNILGLGSREETYQEVKEKVSRLSVGGSYIMSSSNSLTLYCKDENVETMVEAFEKYR